MWVSGVGGGGRNSRVGSLRQVLRCVQFLLEEEEEKSECFLDRFAVLGGLGLSLSPQARIRFLVRVYACVYGA